MYKVYMIIIANKLSKKFNYDAIGTGNALGQVASQTIENIRITNLISEIPVISPLFSYNKESIIKIAIEIKTYDLSICDGTNDCCIMYMPKFPIIKGNYNIVMKNIRKMKEVNLDDLTITQY